MIKVLNARQVPSVSTTVLAVHLGGAHQGVVSCCNVNPGVLRQRDGCGVPVVSHVQQGEEADLPSAAISGSHGRPEDPDGGDRSPPNADEPGHRRGTRVAPHTRHVLQTRNRCSCIL